MKHNYKVEQMAHLTQKEISSQSCKTIIVDTIINSISPLSRNDLSKNILSNFHVVVSEERLDYYIKEMIEEDILWIDSDNFIKIKPIKLLDFESDRAQEFSLAKDACNIWISSIEKQTEVSIELKDCLVKALPIFLSTLFVKHGVTSYELLISTKQVHVLDIKQIANDVSMQFFDEYQEDISLLLPHIFKLTSDPKIMDYLKHSINKAIGYISEVISNENIEQLKEELKGLTLYLDTNVLYRLLNLQGKSRYESIQKTIDFCNENEIKLKISSLTKKELLNRLEYDSKILRQYPCRVNLAKYGYKYRTSENYISTYWMQAASNGLSIDDFIIFYRNCDVLLKAENIEIEQDEIDDEKFIESVNNIFSKLSLRDYKHEKNDTSLWHDAYNLALVRKLQNNNAKTVIDTKCLFLTTDQTLTLLQYEDADFKQMSPISISPLQILQIFGFSKPDYDYEETFIKFFSSSSLGITFKYNNDDIQKLLSKISHYEKLEPQIAEKILCRELINSRYLNASTEEEQEEIVYNDISEELTEDLQKAKIEIENLKSKNIILVNEDEQLKNILQENEDSFANRTQVLQQIADNNKRQKEIEEEKRRNIEREKIEIQNYSDAQERYNVDLMWKLWYRQHCFLFALGVITSLLIICIVIVLCIKKEDIAYSGLLTLLTISVIPLTCGAKVFSKEKEPEIRKKLLEKYRLKFGK